MTVDPLEDFTLKKIALSRCHYDANRGTLVFSRIEEVWFLRFILSSSSVYSNTHQIFQKKIKHKLHASKCVFVFLGFLKNIFFRFLH